MHTPFVADSATLHDPMGVCRIVTPQPETLFAARAARLRSLADGGSAVAAYLRFMARVADAQAALVPGVAADRLVNLSLALARQNGDIPLAMSGGLSPQWRIVLRQLLATMTGQPDLPPNFSATAARLRTAGDRELDELATGAMLDAGAAPLVTAALQVVYAVQASLLGGKCAHHACEAQDTHATHELHSAARCPMCASRPIAGILRIGDPGQAGHRYLHCGLCETEWQLARVICSHCGSTGGVSYLSMEDGPEHVQAETCDDCHGYLKLVDEQKDPMAEPFADDLASLTLDLMLQQDTFSRVA